MYPLLRPILNKGGAGYAISRPETVSRIVPLVRQHQELLRAYDALLNKLADDRVRAELTDRTPRLRTELSKLKETVLSNGGTPPNGTDLEPDGIGVGQTDADALYAVLDREKDYRNALSEEIDAVHHRERTRAILANNAAGSEERLELLHAAVEGVRRPTTRRRTGLPEAEGYREGISGEVRGAPATEGATEADNAPAS